MFKLSLILSAVVLFASGCASMCTPGDAQCEATEARIASAVANLGNSYSAQQNSLAQSYASQINQYKPITPITCTYDALRKTSVCR